MQLLLDINSFMGGMDAAGFQMEVAALRELPLGGVVLTTGGLYVTGEGAWGGGVFGSFLGDCDVWGGLG